MIATTSAYAVCVLSIIGFMFLNEFVSVRAARMRLRDVLARVRFTSLQDSPLLLLPAVDGPLALQPITEDDEDGFSELGGTDAGDSDEATELVATNPAVAAQRTARICARPRVTDDAASQRTARVRLLPAAVSADGTCRPKHDDALPDQRTSGGSDATSTGTDGAATIAGGSWARYKSSAAEYVRRRRLAAAAPRGTDQR
jgi:hypothetical protein